MFDAIIFDLRDNGGGDPKMVALISSYLFDQPTHLTDIYDRKEDSITYIQDYFSGAEDFTYNSRVTSSRPSRGRPPIAL
jgi:C-terminal processing protease CtpA/Prc